MKKTPKHNIQNLLNMRKRTEGLELVSGSLCVGVSVVESVRNKQHPLHIPGTQKTQKTQKTHTRTGFIRKVCYRSIIMKSSLKWIFLFLAFSVE